MKNLKILEKTSEVSQQNFVCDDKKRKYWYHNDVEVCVLCGKETNHRERVYEESEKGTVWKEVACWTHF
jgi:hypothetical protein